MVSQTPVYNLSAVLRETGLKADVLRAWEKRYDLPKPQRSQGGHRLYSQYDIETIKWLRARQAEGLSISRAVELWREITAAGQDPLIEYGAPLPYQESAKKPDANLEVLRSQWLEACLAYNGELAEQILNQAFAIYTVETVCTEILQQGLNYIGASWYSGSATVQQEHFISALATRRIEALIQATPNPTREQTVIIGCPPGELHTFPALLMDLFLRRRGWRVVYLGADVPLDQLTETALKIRPNIVVLSAQQLTTAATLRVVAQSFQQQHIPLAYGGLIFFRVPELRERIPAWFAGETIEQAVQQVEHLAAFPVPFTAEIRMDEAVQAAARLFRDKRPIIEMALLDYKIEDTHQYENIKEVIKYFGDRLSAALELGDPALIEADLDWVTWLLSGRRIDARSLTRFLQAYKEAVQRVLGDQAGALTSWLMGYLNNH